MNFKDVVLQSCESEPSSELIYLRSVSEQGSRARDVKPAKLDTDFPGLWEDVQLPGWLPQHGLFSSILRISSPRLCMWIHYDVMDNALMQVVGRKRVHLFSPKDLPYMYIKGDKSEVVDIENPDLDRFPLFAKATCFSAVLEPGDVLYIPAFWWHGTKALSYSIGVNAFWQDADAGVYDAKDIYGNKDLVPGAQALQDVDRIVKKLKLLPPYHRDFYARRIVQAISERCYQHS